MRCAGVISLIRWPLSTLIQLMFLTTSTLTTTMHYNNLSEFNYAINALYWICMTFTCILSGPDLYSWLFFWPDPVQPVTLRTRPDPSRLFDCPPSDVGLKCGLNDNDLSLFRKHFSDALAVSIANQRMLMKFLSIVGSVALLVARRTNDREVAGSRPTKVVCITVLTGNRMVNCPLRPAATPSSEL